MLEGKVGLVTGAGQGIGRSIALELARQGAGAVAVADLNVAEDPAAFRGAMLAPHRSLDRASISISRSVRLNAASSDARKQASLATSGNARVSGVSITPGRLQG